MELYTTDDGKYRIECMSAATFPGALNVLNESFFHEEAVCVGTEINKNVMAMEELSQICADAALDGVSLVAVSTDTGEVVSVAFNKLRVPSPDLSSQQILENFTQRSSLAVIEWLAEIDSRCNIFKECGVDCSFELMYLSTKKNHRYKNLGKILCEKSVDLARKLRNGPVAKMEVKDLGLYYANMTPRIPTDKIPKICDSLLTAKATQKIGKYLGFEVLLRVSFKDFIYDEKTYEERIGHEAYAEVAVLALN